MTKFCRDCKVAKPLEEFPPNKKNRDGRGPYCKSCMQVRSRASYRKRMGEQGRTVAEPRVAPEGQQWCPDCKAFKPFADFPRNRSAASGRATYCKPCHNQRGRRSIETNHGNTREYHLRRRYGIGQAQVDEMLARQGGRCAVCNRPGPEHVDHDHASGRVRGMLCFNCNQALGNARDEIAVLKGLIRYLYGSRGIDYTTPVEVLQPDAEAGIPIQPWRHGPPAPDPGSVVEVAFAAQLVG